MAGRQTRRRVLGTVGTGLAAGLAGCTSTNEEADDGGTGGDGGAGEGSGGGTTTGDETTADGGSDGEATETTTAVPGQVDCSLVGGEGTPFEVSGTPFVFAFDYPDEYTPQDPVAGPNGRFQTFDSSTQRVGGEPEGVALRVGQTYETVSKAEVDEAIAESTDSEASPFAVLEELTYDGETLRVLGFSVLETDPTALPFYQFWAPHGESDDRAYYRTTMEAFSTLLEFDEDNVATPLCAETIRTAVGEMLASVEPNPDTTIAEVGQ
jgi:hypothetical protein